MTMVTDCKTYQEWVNEGHSISDVTDEATADALTEWFFGYRLGWENESLFERYYKRNLSIYYPMYQQQLRLQPGIGKLLKLDWFVQSYSERQLKHKGKNSGDTTQNTTQNGTNSSSTTHNTTVDQTEYNLMDKDLATTDSDVKSGGHTDTMTGGHSEKFTEGKRTTEVSPHVKRVTTNGGHTSSWSGHSEITAVLPMSKQYSDSAIIEPTDGDTSADSDKEYYQHAYQHMPALDWHDASSQGQTGDRAYNADRSTVTQSYEYDKDNAGDKTVTEGISPDNRQTTYDDEAHNFKYDDETDTRHVGERTHMKTGTQDHRYVSEDTVTGTDETTGSVTGTSSGTSESTDEEIQTGRSTLPADVIARAVTVIQRTNAFKWLVRQLESCFLTDMEDY